MDELDIGQSLCTKFYRLIEPILSTIRYVYSFDNLCLQPRIKDIRLKEIVLEICRPCKHKPSNIAFVVRDEEMLRKLSDLGDIVLPFLKTQTSKTERRLATPAVLLGQIDRKFMKNLAMRASDGAIPERNRGVTSGMELDVGHWFGLPVHTMSRCHP